MLLFFHDIGIPSWGLPLLVFGVLFSPFLSFLGIRYLIKRDVGQVTVVLTTVIMLLLAVGYVAFNVDIDFSVFMIMPFGPPVGVALGIIGAPFVLIFFAAFAINLVSFAGLVRFIEKRFY